MRTPKLLLVCAYLAGPFALLLGTLGAHSAPGRPGTAVSPVSSPSVGRGSTARVLRLEATPAQISLNGPLAARRLLVTAHRSDGTRRDVTGEAALSVSAPTIVSVAAKIGEVVPLADGQATIAATWGGQTVRVPVSVRGTKTDVAPSFVADVVPTLTRLGCSQGPCHGAQSGKGGFKLSLRGYAPELDWVWITRQLGGRRISREAPERSLLLRKPLTEVPHVGGKRLDKNSREYRLLLAWLRAGAPGPNDKEPGVARLMVLPGDRAGLRAGDKQRLVVRAVYSDGRVEDVTHRALFTSNDLAVASVDETGLVTQKRPGETAVIASYRDKLGKVVVQRAVPAGRARAGVRRPQQLRGRSRQRQTQATAHRAIRRVLRPGVPPPRLSGRHRHPAHARRGARLSGQPRPATSATS
jgi:hypothetical protein